jgi:hypothetical protein
MVIRVSNIVKDADTSDEGNAVLPTLVQELERDGTVSISFAGIDTVTSSFVNAAFYPLLTSIPISELRRRLRIIDSTRQINDMIKRCFDRYGSIAAA